MSCFYVLMAITPLDDFSILLVEILVFLVALCTGEAEIILSELFPYYYFNFKSIFRVNLPVC